MLNKWVFVKIPIYFLEKSASINAKSTFKFDYMVRLNEGTLNGNPACGVNLCNIIYVDLRKIYVNLRNMIYVHHSKKRNIFSLS